MSSVCHPLFSMFLNGNFSGNSHFEQTACLLPHRYVELPIRRCRNMAKPLVDLQQMCNRGPCPELPRVLPGRTPSSAVVLGWYSSPWQQVHLSLLSSKTVYMADFKSYMCIPANNLSVRAFSPTYDTHSIIIIMMCLNRASKRVTSGHFVQ